jgi:glycosyltransferase involved in cell wall biosynthesis
MRISLIAAYYKDFEALKLIIEAAKRQTYNNFELIVAEDNNYPDLSHYLESINDIDIIHTSQDDLGIRKARSVNNAILKSTGDYLIFIDADCIPYHTFIASHASLAQEGYVLSGRRVNVGRRISTFIRNGSIKPSTLERYFLLATPLLMMDGATHLGQGLYFRPDGSIYRDYISRRKRSNMSLLGCNFSCFKSDMIAINGFDESYGETALPDDTDIQWRFDAYGLKFKTCKMAANVFHLHHRQIKRVTQEQAILMKNKMKAKKESGSYKAEIGLSAHNI